MAGSRRVARSRRLADRRLADIDKDISPGTRVKKRFSTDAGMEWYHGRVTSVREADAYPICVTYDDGEKESYDRAEFHRDVVVCRDAVTPPRVPPASDEHDKRRRRDDDTPNSARASTGRRRPRKRQSRPSATAAQGRRLAIDFEEHARSHSEDTCPPAFTTTASATTTTETQTTTTETQTTITETETRSTSTTCERCRGWRAEEFDAHAYNAFTAMLMRSEADRVQAGCGTGVAGAHGPYQVTIDDGVRVVRSRDCKGVLHDVRGHRCQACSGVTVKHIKRDVHNALNAKSNNFKHALLHGSAHQSMKDAATSRKALARKARALEDKLRRMPDTCGGGSVERVMQSVEHDAEGYLKGNAVALQVWRASMKNASVPARARRWPNQVVAFALALIANSNRRTYDELRKVFCLPSLTTAKRKRGALAREADGVQYGALRSLAKKLSDSGEKGVLCFDSCAVKGQLEFDAYTGELRGLSGEADISVAMQALADMVEKKEDDNKTELITLTKHHLVFYWCSLESSRAMIIARYSLPTITADFLVREIDKIMRDLYTHGADTIAVVADGAGENRAWWSAVATRDDDGALAFEHVAHARRVYVLPDMPHIIKRLRNALDSSARQLLFRGQRIGLDILENAWFLSGGADVNTLRDGGEDGICPLSKAHFNLDAFSRMRVNLAMQVFGKRAQDCLERHGTGPRGAMKSVMEVVDNLVDYCNDARDDIAVLQECSQLFSEWRTSTANNKKHGLPWELYDDISSLCAGVQAVVRVLPHVQRRKLQQDIVENHFNNARHSAGGSQALDERSANVAAATSMCMRISQHEKKKGNCIDDKNTPFKLDDPENAIEVDTRERDLTRERF